MGFSCILLHVHDIDSINVTCMYMTVNGHWYSLVERYVVGNLGGLNTSSCC